jgi:hypothetical protein
MMSGRLSPSAAAPRQDPLGAPRLINAIDPLALPRATSEYIISSAPPRFTSRTAITSETRTRCEPEGSRRYASES